MAIVSPLASITISTCAATSSFATLRVTPVQRGINPELAGEGKEEARGEPTDTNGNLGAPEIGSFNFIAGKREFRGSRGGISRKHRAPPPAR